MSMDDLANIVCPECGGDVCVVHDTARGWMHRSRVLARVAWVVLCLGLIGYWVSIGQYSSALTPANTTSQQARSNRWIDATLNPSIMGAEVGEDLVYVSAQDLRDAIDGDEDALVSVAQKFGEAAEYNRRNKDSSALIERVQFAWHEPYGTFGSLRRYRFGRSLLWLSESIMLEDIRDHDSVGRALSQRSWDEGGWFFWPRFGHTNITRDGAITRSWDVDLVGVFQLVCVCLAGAWLIGLAVGLIGLSKKKRFTVRCGVFIVLLISAGLVSWSEASVYTYERGESSQDIALSGAWTLDYLDGVIADENKMSLFCQDLLGLIPDGYGEDLLLAQAWDYVPVSRQVIDPSKKAVVLWIKYTLLIEYHGYQFEHVDEAREIQQLLDGSMWDRLIKSGMLSLRWGPLERQSTLSIGVFTWISIGVVFGMLWTMTHWVSRLVFGRIQKRRVRRAQCIFCAYPLSDEGKRARACEAPCGERV
jgi:hypothetical protein